MHMNNSNVMALAREVADEFLTIQDMDQSVVKVARNHELNPRQIRRVVEASNHEVNSRIYKSAADKRFAFKLANADNVLELLNVGKKETSTKTASADDDFFSLRRHTKVASASNYTHRSRSMGGEDALKQAVLFDLKMAEAHLEKHARELKTEQLTHYTEAQEAMSKVASEVRRMILEEHLPFQSIYKAACSVLGPEHQPFVQAVFETVKKHNEKHANALEGKEYRAFDGKDYESLGGKIVNGNQPLFIHLKIVNKALGTYRGFDCLSEGFGRLHGGVVQAIHALNTNKEVDDYIAKEVQSYANNVCKGVKFAMAYAIENADKDTWFAKTANIGGAARTLEQASRVFQFLNQMIGAGGTAHKLGRNFLSDLFAPAVIRPGYAISTAGMDRAEHGGPTGPQMS